jgi:putative hydrolase of the HAD superfamily
MAIRCAFFDFDEVLRTWEYEVSDLGEIFGIPLDDFREVAFAREISTPAVRGQITDEEWRANVGKILAERFPDRDVEAAMQMWSGRIGKLIPEVHEIIQACKARVPVGLMTNATSKLNQDLATLGLSDLFDYVVNASEVGSIKPEPGIYRHALELAGIESYEAFFADDRPENVAAAERLGWVGHVFENAEGLRTALVKAGVLAS